MSIPKKRKKKRPKHPEHVPRRVLVALISCVGVCLLGGLAWLKIQSPAEPSASKALESQTAIAERAVPSEPASIEPATVKPSPAASVASSVAPSPAMPARNAGAKPPPNRRRQPKAEVGETLASAVMDKFRNSPSILSFTEHPVWAPTDGNTKARFVWGDIPDAIRKISVTSPQAVSNVRPADYVGADACKSCHTKNYESWAVHPHRWMNAKANAESVMGDFSDDASIQYRGGNGTFYMENDAYRMQLERDDIVRVYSINRTIGSRFQQYYVGRLLDGPDRDNHPVRQIDFVLPFGYWLDKHEWVPVVHVDLELPDEQRHDPFLHPANRPYDRSCASCHTTQVAGDRMLRAVGRERLAAYSPHDVVYDGLGYLEENRKEVLDYAEFYGKSPTDKIKKALSVMDDLAAETYAAALGVTCEGCHNGVKFHAEHQELLPRFYPSGDQVAVLGKKADGVDGGPESIWGRNKANLNWTCAQCHTGGRSMFACGASTWNSTEYSDAMRGSCYDPLLAKEKSMECLTCVHCHDPHEATGKRWKHSPDVDDQRCLSCHEQFNDAKQRLTHTHYPAGTAGDRCMNCHMPKINEGMQDVVRTHLIFSPTDTAMLEANHPNACNLCHSQENIDWTLSYLEDWYGLKEQGRAEADTESWKIYDSKQMDANYPNRKQPVGIGWLQSDNEATRLVAIEALAKAKSEWALPQMVEMLDDSYLMNRQFAAQRLEEMLNVDLQDFGYRHYQYAEERRGPLKAIRNKINQ